MGGLYYFYAFDPGCHTYRVTDYASYCPDARQPDGSWLVCVELHYEPGTEVDIIEARAHAERELIYFGVIKDNSEILAAKVYPKPGGFPVLTLRNCDLMRELRSRLVAEAPSNLVIRGQAPECGIFFLHEALEQCHQGIVEFEGWM